jgi:hypothetical protein
MRRPLRCLTVDDADMVLSMIIVGLIAAISTALVLWWTPPHFVPMEIERKRINLGTEPEMETPRLLGERPGVPLGGFSARTG